MSNVAGSVSDAEQRERALSPDESFIVQAPAGSGKTELLIRRVLTLLGTVGSPEEILAITFTRKAAAEMRHRIHETLQKAASDGEPEDAHEAEGLKLAKRVLARDLEQGWGILENPQRLTLQTIDSMCTMLTRQLPVTSNLGAPLATEERAEPMYLEAAGRAIERGLSDDGSFGDCTRAMLLEVDNKVAHLQNMLAGMLGNRDQWLRYVLDDQSSDDRREVLQASLNDIIEQKLSAVLAVMPDVFDDKYFELLSQAEYCQRELLGKSSYAGLLELGRAPIADIAESEAWKGLADSLLTTGGGLRKRLTRGEGFPAKADSKAVGIDESELKSRKEAFGEILGSLADETEFVEALHGIRGLPYEGYSDEQWRVLGQLTELLLNTVAELNVVFGAGGKCDFSEVSQRAHTALGDSESPTDLALVLDYRIHHILVDEFQDTSISQFGLFKKLVAGWEPGDGRTFFAVGDPMQSIYRFRDAEVSLFTEARDHGVGQVKLEPLQLEVNFRSSKLLVDWSNEVFSQIFPQTSDRISGAVPFSASTAFKTTGVNSEQQLFCFDDKQETEQAEKIVSLVQQVFAIDDEQSAAILVRSRSALVEIFVALRGAGIACQAVEMEALANRLVVRDIRSLAFALMHTSDRISWLSLLRAPWCALSLEELHALVETDRYAPIWQTISGDLNELPLSDASRTRLQNFRDIMEPAVNRAKREELAAWVEACWLQLGGPMVCQELDASENIELNQADLIAADTALKTLASLETAGLIWNRPAVDSRLESLFAPSAEGQSPCVQIMSIHKSKGLEFDTVILPNLGRKPRTDTSRLLNWFELIDENGGSDLLLAPLNTTTENKADKEPIARLIASFHSEREKNERVRLLYVAATRARQRLYLCGHAKPAKDGVLKTQPGSLLQTLWLVVNQEFNENLPQDETADTGEAPTTPVSTELAEKSRHAAIPLNWQLPSAVKVFDTPISREVTPNDQFEVPDFLWASPNASAVGVVVHRQLQRICEAGLELWDESRIEGESGTYLLQLRSAGVPEAALDECAATVRKALSRCLLDKRGRWILETSHECSETELALSTAGPDQVENIVIDRSFVDEEGVCWIIDYKTGDHRGGSVEAFLDSELERYQSQLERYARVVALTTDAPIALGLYFPLLQGWREWRWQPALEL